MGLPPRKKKAFSKYWNPQGGFSALSPKEAFEKYHKVMSEAKLEPEALPLSKAEEFNAASSAPEAVDHPPHYNAGSIECIDYIEDQDLGFCTGNAVKYITRHRHKGTPIKDLEKAVWYLQRGIAALKKGQNRKL